MCVGLYETVFKKTPRSFHFACWDKRSILCKILCGNRRTNNYEPPIILRTDDKKSNEKGMEVNLYLKELSKEKNIFLIDNSRKLKLNILTNANYIQLNTVQEY